MKITIECCGRRKEILGNKIETKSDDDFDMYFNDDGKFVIECAKCNKRIRFINEDLK